MPTIPYTPLDATEPAALVSAIRQRRGGTLLNLDRMLLHSPPFAEGWNRFLGTVRTGLALPAQLRELVICAVGRLNDAEYEVFQHAPVFLAEGGSQAKLDALHDIDHAAGDGALFDETERLALQAAIAMTRRVQVDPALLGRLATLLGGNRQLVELVGVVATYNMVSRFLVALQVEPE